MEAVWDGDEYRTELDPDEELYGIMDDASGYFFVDLDRIWFSFRQREVFGNDTPRGLGMKPEDVLEVVYLDDIEDTEPYTNDCHNP